MRYDAGIHGAGLLMRVNGRHRNLEAVIVAKVEAEDESVVFGKFDCAKRKLKDTRLAFDFRQKRDRGHGHAAPLRSKCIMRATGRDGGAIKR